MKRLSLFFALLLLATTLSANPVGTILFFRGEVLYQANQNQALSAVKIGSPVLLEGYLKTALDSSVEIKWNDGSVTKLGENKHQSIRKLFDEASSKSTWNTKLKGQIQGLSLPKKQASSVAGIRRDEVIVEKTSLLYWDKGPEYILADAIAMAEAEQYPQAISAFLKIIEQAPLKRDAEISHSYLIMIYDATDDYQNRDKHHNLLKTDFPNSAFLKTIPDQF